jgi:hypothetical protein
MGAHASVITNTSQVFKDGVSTLVQFTGPQAADPGMLDLAAKPTRITITQAGRYHIVGGGGFTTGNATGRVVAWLRKNGNNIPYGGQSVPIINLGPYSEFSARAEVVLDLWPTDYIELVINQKTGYDQSFNYNPWQLGHLIVTQVS